MAAIIRTINGEYIDVGSLRAPEDACFCSNIVNAVAFDGNFIAKCKLSLYARALPLRCISKRYFTNTISQDILDSNIRLLDFYLN